MKRRASAARKLRSDSEQREEPTFRSDLKLFYSNSIGLSHCCTDDDPALYGYTSVGGGLLVSNTE